MSARERLASMGLTLPQPPNPVATYLPVVVVDGLAYVSGQGPTRNGEPVVRGKVGAEVSLEEGYEAARLCALNALAALEDALGSLERIERFVKLLGFVASAPGFGEQPRVINGASDLLVEIFGEAGRHARSALGTSQLPFDIPVEIELLVRVRGR